jgi:anti-anti-sigma regulatory factor
MQIASAGALSVAFQHPAITGDVKTVRNLLQTCKAWQAALQQCSAGHLNIKIVISPSTFTRQALAHFAGWLPKHSGLVGELYVFCRRINEPKYVFAIECAAAEQILALSIQHAANRAAAPEAAPLLRLRSSTIRDLYSPALLQALPAAALTKLVLRYSRKDWPAHLSLNSSHITQGLQRLTGLQELHLECSEQHGSWVQDACLGAVGQLTQLTQLQMCCVAAGSDLSLLPRQICDLQLGVCCSSSSMAVALGHLSALQQLELSLYGDVGLGSSLPTGLTGLTVLGFHEDSNDYSSTEHLSLEPLQQLQQLWLRDAAVDAQQLQALSRVSALTSISIEHHDMLRASRQAPAWRHLPALKTLHLYCKSMVGSEEQEPRADQLDQAASLALLECLAAATSLTHLQLLCTELLGTGEVPQQAWCGYLTSLQQLQSLTLFKQLPLDREDLLQLTALTNLRALNVRGVEVLDDAAVVSLALGLKQLQQLYLNCVTLTCTASLPAIATLTGLTALFLSTASEEQQQWGHADLKLLTALTGLRMLETDLFDYEAVWDLWDAGRGWVQ